MEAQELIARIKALNALRNELGTNDNKVVAELSLLMQAAFNETFKPGCKSCASKAFQKLNLLTIKKIEAMANSQYKLKAGIVIQWPAFSQTYVTSDNLTDEKAREILKGSPELAEWFEQMPDEEESTTPGKTSAVDIVKAIKAANTTEEVAALSAGDDRKTVTDAAAARLKDLSGDAENVDLQSDNDKQEGAE